jgi:hypothetical protein
MFGREKGKAYPEDECEPTYQGDVADTTSYLQLGTAPISVFETSDGRGFWAYGEFPKNPS